MVHLESKQKYAFLLIPAALTTLLLKFSAYHLSFSIGLFSDAVESLVNLSTAFVALFALIYAAKPADREHAYGHEKIEFFASGLEGSLIIAAAIWIIYESIHRFLNPQPLENIFRSLVISLIAAGVNALVARYLLKAARGYQSIVLEAGARHLLADVWTTGGVGVGLLLFVWTGFAWLDPLIAFLVGLHVIFSGLHLAQRSFQGLMDRGLPEEEIKKIKEIVKKHIGPRGDFHALRTRQSGARRFVDFHLLMPQKLSLREAHEKTLIIEKELEATFHEMDVTIHMEPLEDPKSWEEDSLSRKM